MTSQPGNAPAPVKPKSNKIKIILIVVGVVFLCCIATLIFGTIRSRSPEGRLTSTAGAVEHQATQTQKAQPTNTKTPTITPMPTDTLAPTNTIAPTNTPEPTNTPGPTDTPTQTPTPIVLSGTGDAIVDVAKGPDPALVHITGNASSGYFGVTNYDASGNTIDLLVNTTDPYDGVRPLDFVSGDYTTRFEVKASGAWTIEVLPLSSIEKVQIPGEKSGTGDYVFALDGGTPDLAKITGNAGAAYFGVYSYSKTKELLVNTTDPYDGTVMLSSDTIIIEVVATGDWTINITTR